MAVSSSEAAFAASGLRERRRDGRSAADFRAVSLQLGIAPAAAGSARARLAGSDVLVACRLEVEDVDPLNPSGPELRCSVDWYAVGPSSTLTC